MRTFPPRRLNAVAALGLLALLGGCASAPYDTAYYDAYTYGQMHSYSTEYGPPPPQNVPPPAPRPPRIISMPQPEGGMPSLTPRTPTLGNGVEMP